MAKRVRAGVRAFQVTDNENGGTTSFDVGGSASIELSGEMRETLESANNPAPGYSSKQTRGRLEVEGLDAGTVSLTAIQAWSDVTAILTLANGKTYAARGWLVDKPSLDAINGTLSVALEGIVTEQTFG